MTSSLITDRISLGGVQTLGKQQNNSDVSNFASFMQKENTPNAFSEPSDFLSQKTNAKEAYKSSGSEANKKVVKNQKLENKKLNKSEENDAVSEVEKQTVKKISEELGVSEEEVKEAMETLGLTAADLFENGNLTDLVALLEDVSSIDIVSNAELFESYSELTADLEKVLTDVADALGTTKEQLLETIQNTVSMNEVADRLVSPMSELEPADEALLNEKDLLHVENSQELISGQEQFSANTGLQNDLKDSDTKDSGRDNHQAGEQLLSAMNVNPDNVNVNPEIPAESLDQLRQNVDAQDVIDQIAKQVRVTHSEQVTEMEMRLNPANLGMVHLQVSSKAGTITAQLSAQDEAVRAALESQIQVLKDNLEQSGLKVDAIEITAQSHQFEENLDQQGRQEENEAQRAAASVRNTRRILDLNDLDEGMESEEEMTQEQKLQVEMMRMAGNRMNYMV